LVDTGSLGGSNSVAIAPRHTKRKCEVTLYIEENVALGGHALLESSYTESLVCLGIGQGTTDVVCSSSEPLKVELVRIEFILESREVVGGVVGWVSDDAGKKNQQQRADQQGFIHD